MSRTSNQEARIAALAYAYWIDRGRPFGSPEIDWYRAIATLELHQPARHATVQFGPDTSGRSRR